MSQHTTKATIRLVLPGKTQLSLAIRPVWSKSSLCTQWVAKDPHYLKADSKDWANVQADPSLCWVHKSYCRFCRFWFVLGFNYTSTSEGHFVSSPEKKDSRGGEKRDRRDSRGDEREGQGRKRNRNESEETEEIKTFPLYHYLLQRQQAMPNCKPVSVGFVVRWLIYIERKCWFQSILEDVWYTR